MNCSFFSTILTKLVTSSMCSSRCITFHDSDVNVESNCKGRIAMADDQLSITVSFNKLRKDENKCEGMSECKMVKSEHCKDGACGKWHRFKARLQVRGNSLCGTQERFRRSQLCTVYKIQ